MLRTVIVLVAVSSAHFSMGASTVVAWGDNYYGQCTIPANLTNVISVSAGYIHSLALTADGRVIGWGNSDHGQANPPSDLTNAVAIQAMAYSSVALCADGKVVAWGFNNVGQANIPLDLTNVAAISVGDAHGLALLSNGTVRAWGYSRNGQADVPAGLTNIKAVAAGGDYSIALKQDGTVFGWGKASGPLSNLTNETNIVAATATDCCAMLLREDGMLIESGLSPFFQIWFRREEFIGQGVIEADGGQVGGLFRFKSGKLHPHGSSTVGMPPNLQRVVAVGSGGMHSVVLVNPQLIQTQPVHRVVAEGSSVTLQIDAVSNVELKYQWYFGGSLISGATGSALRIASVNLAHAGNYLIEVSDRYGSATSSNAQLTVVGLITNQTVSAGRPVSFAPALGGTNALSFQWTLNGSPVMGGNGRQLVISNAQAHHAGSYAVRVQQVSGAATNVSADLAVLPAPPTIVMGLSDQSVPAGTNVSLRVIIIGSEPFAYQWQFNGTDVPGATNAELDLADVQLEAAGTYRVRIGNSEGQAQSEAVLTVQASAPWINVHPVTHRVPQGMEFRFSVKAAGSRPLVHQWYFMGTAIAGATNLDFFIDPTEPSQSGDYSVVVSNLHGSITSRVGRLTIRPSPGLVTLSVVGRNDCFELSHGGATNFAQFDGGCYWNLTGLRNDGVIRQWTCQAPTVRPVPVPTNLTDVVEVDSAMSGGIALKRNGRVACWGADVDCPGDASNVVAVAAAVGCKIGLRSDGTLVTWGSCGPPGFAEGLREVIDISGGIDHFLALRNDGTVVAWSLNFYGNNHFEATVPAMSNAVAISAGIDGSAAVIADGSVVTWGRIRAAPGDLVDAIDVSVGSEHVVALRSNGTVRSWGEPGMYGHPPLWLGGVTAINADCTTSFFLTRYPVFISEPQNASAVAGSNVTFRVQAAGHGPLRYAWEHEGLPVPEATDSGLVISNVQVQHRGNYTVRVFNSEGSIVSAPAHLTVSPSFIQHPRSSVATVGRNVTFTAIVTGSEPFTYTWYKSNTLVATTLVPQFSISNVQARHAGLFSVEAQNAAGARRSTAAVLRVVPPITAGRNGARMRVSWPAWTNGLQVEFAPDLVTQAWRPVTVNIVSNSFTVPTSGQHGFYRLMPRP